VSTTAGARVEFKKLAAEYPELKFVEVDADAEYTQASVNGVLQSLLEGIVLTAIVMLLFLHAWRNAVVVMISIPVSLLATFIVMKLFGFTLDVISLMGLGLTIGILVDDSIVVLENIVRHRDQGEAPLEAAYTGRTEIGSAAIAITLVDVVVFLPIAFLTGIVGKFMKEFGRHRGGDALLAARLVHVDAVARGPLVGEAAQRRRPVVGARFPALLRPVRRSVCKARASVGARASRLDSHRLRGARGRFDRARAARFYRFRIRALIRHRRPDRLAAVSRRSAARRHVARNGAPRTKTRSHRRRRVRAVHDRE
ncbi:MAG: efflux RND transporter permease subunit, partial [Candidatus Eremiobacteraeota bacterium]|nr:efflux RND transporter permease subunit [Candidatus Eremiobacteraeota bacterium]